MTDELYYREKAARRELLLFIAAELRERLRGPYDGPYRDKLTRLMGLIEPNYEPLADKEKQP